MKRRSQSLWMSVVLGAGLVLVSVGCTAVNGGPLSLFGSPRKKHDIHPGQPVYTVEFYQDGSQIDKYVAPIGGQMTVQDALKEARATDQFERVKVTLLRGKHRMEVDYKNFKDEVEPLTNYHLHAGDRLIVQPDPHSLLDDALEAFDTPMAKSLTAPL